MKTAYKTCINKHPNSVFAPLHRLLKRPTSSPLWCTSSNPPPLKRKRKKKKKPRPPKTFRNVRHAHTGFQTVIQIRCLCRCSHLFDQLLADGDEFGFHAPLSVGGSPRVEWLTVAGEVGAAAGFRDDGCVLHLSLWLSLICRRQMNKCEVGLSGCDCESEQSSVCLFFLGGIMRICGKICGGYRPTL